MTQNLCLATNYLLMTETHRRIWIAFDRYLQEAGTQLVLLSTAEDDAALPFPVIPISFLLRDYAQHFPGACLENGAISEEDMRLLAADCARAQGAYAPQDALPGLRTCRRLTKKLLEILQPGYVLTWDSTSPLSHILRTMAHETGTPVQAIERGLLPETLMVESRGIQGYSDLRTHWLAQEMPASSFDPAAYERIRSYYLTRRPQKYDQPSFGGGGEELRRQLRLGTRKVVVFFGHYDCCGLKPGDTLERHYHSPGFDSTRDALMSVWACLERDSETVLVFKPHPLDSESYVMAEADGICVVRDVNVHALIDLADVVAAQLTTLQFEAALYGKPVLLLGHSAWWGREAAYEAARRADLPSALEAALGRKEWPTRSANARAFLTWIMDHFLIGYDREVPTRRGLQDFARFIARTSLINSDAPPMDERWLRMVEILNEMRSPRPCAAASLVFEESGPSLLLSTARPVRAQEETQLSALESAPTFASREVGLVMPNLDTLLTQARKRVTANDLADAFRIYRQALAMGNLTPADAAALAREWAPLLPCWLPHAASAERDAFMHVLRLHPEFARQLVAAVEKHAARQAAALALALGTTCASVGHHAEALSIMDSIDGSVLGSPSLVRSFEEARKVEVVAVQAAQRGGWATRKPTPYPLAADGRPKLSPVWFEVTSFCNQKCSFCPDRWREVKRKAIDLEVFKKCIDELKRDFHVEYLQLNAYGEPLLHPKFEQILTYLREGHAPAPFFFTTHGMTLNERNIAMLNRAHPHGICVSLQNDNEASYAATRNLRLGNYEKLARQVRQLIERFVQNRRACHVRIYQLLSNGKEGYGVPAPVLDAFPRDWKRFAAVVREWEDSLRPLANGRTVQAVRNTDDAVREAFEAADHPAWWVKLDLLRWKDERGGEQSAFLSPRPIGTYANQLPYHTPGWKVTREPLHPHGCCFTKNPGLAIFSNGNLGICCLSVNQNASFGRLQDFPNLKQAVSSEACFHLFAELSNGVTRASDCQVCLGSVERAANGARCEIEAHPLISFPLVSGK